ncbi:hypothetical protein LRS73_26055 [Methylobacterium currus]|uniref:hypothetical protein n=1 Tax=Methylobacterium currus TaxID=2051553 RepID=UPI001E4846CD|nr:hypothetical protein [Methylobacterium currus]UHC15907.1 hypothetical protein LRS73_26055 [Methylobacterium currus]
MPQVVRLRLPPAFALGLAAAELVLAAAGLFLAAAPAFAQAPETAVPRVVYGDGVRAPAIMVDPETSRTPGMVDESALRYYASQKQTARMKAEIARLKRLYPGWTEPPDLDSLQPSPPEEAPLWDLFTAGRLQDLRAAITARRSVEPSWQPSEELGRKLRRAEFRSSIAAAAGKNPEEVVALYRADPSALDPADVESIWTIADDLAATGATEDAFNLYKSVLDGNADTGARLATIQKAMAHIKMEQAERLIAMGRQDPGRQDSSGVSEFEPIRLDITRARIAAFLHDEPAQTPTLPELSAFQAYARKTAEPSQTGLLGWYAYKRRQFREALEWFKLAIARGGDAMVAHGLAHTLRELNMMREAEEVAFAWRDRFVGNELLFIDLLERKLTLASPPYIEPARIERYARVVNATASGEGAQGLAWYAYNSCQFDAALEWFQRAVAWMPSESTVFGYALTLQRLRRQRPYLEVVNRYDGLFPKVVDLLFRESQGGPPLPCAVQVANAPTGRAAPAAANAPRPEPQATYGRVPRPDAPGAGGRAEAVPPAVQRGEFPLAVPLDNPLRYPAAGQGPGQAAAGTYAREPAVPAPPLVARRVPGAGAMPYERYGYTLLPGYNGLDKPEGLSAPPPGTLWQDQQGDRTRSASPESVRFSVPARSTSERALPSERGYP